MLQLKSKPGWVLENLWVIMFHLCFVPEMWGHLQKQVSLSPGIRNDAIC
jgi:hypothetical protein